jgi:orotidine-5'-phosphate decarboxylase
MTRQQLIKQIQSTGSYLCIGLDTDLQKLPKHLQSGGPDAVLTFNKAIIDATLPTCLAYKLNTAFYEAMGARGWEIMEETAAYIPSTHLKIADAKRGDIGNTSGQYARAFFETLRFDAVTVAPYMGEDSIRPFLDYPDKWTIVLGLTSNVGSADFQQLKIAGQQADLPLVPNITGGHRSELLYEKVLETVCTWGTPDNLMFVVGATQAAELTHIRSLVSNHFLLVPGVGAQGGSLEEVSRFGLNREVGLLVNASRAVIFASGDTDYADAARKVAEGYQAEMQPFVQQIFA